MTVLTEHDLIQKLKSCFSSNPLNLSADLHRYACVAVILRGRRSEDLEVGFIRRAIQDMDRWSGQIAFPGGKHEPTDLDSLSTAVRETHEEIGLQLSADNLLGRLNDIQARKAGQLLDFYIRPYVFYFDSEFSPVLDPREVADFFWLRLDHLQQAEQQSFYEWTDGHENRKLPAIRMPNDSSPPLWGLTWMMTQELLSKIQLSNAKIKKP